MKTEFPTIQIGVPGPDGRPGFLLIVPRDEALEWDIRDEIVSTSRYWVPDRQAWWIAAPYLPTAVPLNDEPHIARFLRAPTRYRIAVTERTEEGRDVARPVRPGVFDLPILVAHRARRAASQALRGPGVEGIAQPSPIRFAPATGITVLAHRTLRSS